MIDQLRSVQVVGAGLLGTSVALALTRAGWRVWVTDTDPAAVRLAGDLGAGEPGWAPVDPDVVLLAVPPSALANVMQQVKRLFVHSTVSDLTSIKIEPQLEAERCGLADRFVGGHPMAGRERSGAAAAQADLFDARPWALCPSPACDADRVRVVEQLVRDCGADPVRLDAESHDAAVALVSHLPQIAASGVAGLLTGADAVTMVLAGQGLRDTVRIAGSEPSLWSDILRGNAATVAPLVERLAAELAELGAALRAVSDGSSERQVDKTIERFLRAGRDGYQAIPGKHGSAPAEYSVVTVVIPDEAGALARLFATVATAGASVEDIQLEHSPGHPVGIIELAVRPDQTTALRAALDRDGWSSH